MTPDQKRRQDRLDLLVAAALAGTASGSVIHEDVVHAAVNWALSTLKVLDTVDMETLTIPEEKNTNE